MIKRAVTCGNVIEVYFAPPPQRRSANPPAIMRSLFYQANFCAECGNPVELHPTGKQSLGWRNALRLHMRALRPRYFCDDCAARLHQQRLLTPLAGVLLATSLALFAFSYRNGYKRGDQLNAPPALEQNAAKPAPPVSAQDSVVNAHLKSKPESSARVLCGARTRRGTPCRHLAPPGERCAQHRGMPSMLERESSPSAMTPGASPSR